MPPRRAAAPADGELARAAPRPRTEYARGAVKRIRAENFMTYGNMIDFQPGPALNLVIGPNGAGKSTLVCALCIGLGGAPSLLGRARDLSEYVRRGARDGWVEITLASGRPRVNDLVIRRALFADSARSEWKLNGAPCTGREAMEAVRSLNIQLDNLCQFLPQDRVSEFARLTPSALLVETQRASEGSRELMELHAKAAAASAASTTADARAAGLRGELAAAARQQEAVRVDAERLQQREVHLRRAQLARTKIKLLGARAASRRVEETRRFLAEADRTIAVHEAALGRRAPAAARGNARARGGSAAAPSGEDLEASAKELEASCRTVPGRIDAVRRPLERALLQRVVESKERVEAARYKLLELPDIEAERRAALRSKEQHFEECQAQLNAVLLRETESLRDGVDRRQLQIEAQRRVQRLRSEGLALRAELASKDLEHRQKSDELRELRVSWRKAKEKSSRAGGERAWRGQRLRVTEVLNEVDRLKHIKQFQGSVFGPVGAEMQLKNDALMAAAASAGLVGGDDDNDEDADAEAALAVRSLAARMLEAALSRDLLSQFVATNEGDHKRIVDFVKNFHAPSAVAQVNEGGVFDTGGNRRPPRKIQVTEELRRLGVACTLGDLIDAPPEIKRVLEDDSGVDSGTLVSFASGGCAPSLAAVQAVAPSARALITPDGVQHCLRSRYNRAAVTTTIAPLQAKSRLFEDEEGARQRALAVRAAGEAVAKADEEVTALYAEMNALQARQNEHLVALRAAEQELHNLKSEREKAEAALENARISLDAERAKPSLEEMRRKALEQLAAGITQASAAAAEAADAAESLGVLSREAAPLEALAVETKARFDAVRAVMELHRSELRRAKASRRDITRNLETEEREAERALAAVGDVAPEGKRDPSEFDEETRREFDRLPNSVDTLEDVAGLADAEAAGVVATDATALARFNERGAAVDRLRSEVAAAENEAQREAEAAAEARAAWLPRAKALIETVGQEFTAAMRRLGCDGDAALVEGEESAQQQEQEGEDRVPCRPPNPSKASVRLRVRFREGEPLQALDGSRQSGGERSVSTILYLVALQRVASAPFRVVDEINQGMDPNNERAVFGVLAEAAGAPGTPQCFLLTPKLLPDLPYSDAVTVLQVVNGPVAEGCVTGAVDASRMLLGGGGSGMLGRGGGGRAVPARG